MTREEITQTVRGIDLILFVPLLLAAASDKNLNPYLRIALGFTGIATGVYNGINLYTHLK